MWLFYEWSRRRERDKFSCPLFIPVVLRLLHYKRKWFKTSTNPSRSGSDMHLEVAKLEVAYLKFKYLICWHILEICILDLEIHVTILEICILPLRYMSDLGFDWSVLLSSSMHLLDLVHHHTHRSKKIQSVDGSPPPLPPAYRMDLISLGAKTIPGC